MTSTFEFWQANLPEMLSGLGVSLQLTILALILGFPLGLILAVASSTRSRSIRWTAIAIVEVGRGAPALVVLYVVYFGLPILSLTPEAYVCAVIGLTYTTASYTAEYIRGGLKSVSAGSIEAGNALAMSQLDVLRFIIVPQGLRVALPSLMGFAILIFQATSLTYSITVTELTAVATSISSSSFRALEIFGLAGIMYAAITLPASWATNKVDQHMSNRY